MRGLQKGQRCHRFKQLFTQAFHRLLISLGFGLYLFELAQAVPITLQRLGRGYQPLKRVVGLGLSDLLDFLERFVDSGNGGRFIRILGGEGVGLHLITRDLDLLPQL
ncbi:hypothetical protein ALP29_200248 [Pseudomonas syringae pv. avii]|uniref:Uncharacterized protein n=1 Tax=Pseudomonas syringae pv. avii TaxID=663959 RepID=A0A3M5U7H8_PSESX|nr:hypothetical protein ALP29_200248 [Pseudomonas syringae pv. avii]